jgi:hypothetical protein
MLIAETWRQNEKAQVTYSFVTATGISAYDVTLALL